MLHGIEITIKQMVGRKKGLLVTEPTDVIYATKNGITNKIGFVGRYEGATCLLIRHLPLEVREEVRREVERLRTGDPEGCSIAATVSSVPDPRLVKAYVKGELHKKKTTSSIILPDGMESDDEDDDSGPFGDEDDE